MALPAVSVRGRGPTAPALWRGFAAFAGLALIAVAASARGADEPLIPKPRGFVNDFAGVLDAGTVAHLEALIKELREKTGAEIAVVTIDSTKPLSEFDYAMKIAESWKPGAAGKDNGVVFLTAVRDRRMFILTGYGVEGALPDGRVGELRDRLVVPRFRAGDMAGGIRAGTEAMASIIAEDAGVQLSTRPLASQARTRRGGGDEFALNFAAVVALVILFAVLASVNALAGGRRRGTHLGTFGGSFGGGGFGGGGGDFGGFGGGSFGGGGAGGGW